MRELEKQIDYYKAESEYLPWLKRKLKATVKLDAENIIERFEAL